MCITFMELVDVQHCFRVYCDSSVISELMITMGFPKEDITEALLDQKYDEVMATYLLLGRKPPEVKERHHKRDCRTCCRRRWVMFDACVL